MGEDSGDATKMPRKALYANMWAGVFASRRVSSMVGLVSVLLQILRVISKYVLMKLRVVEVVAIRRVLAAFGGMTPNCKHLTRFGF